MDKAARGGSGWIWTCSPRAAGGAGGGRRGSPEKTLAGLLGCAGPGYAASRRPGPRPAVRYPGGGESRCPAAGGGKKVRRPAPAGGEPGFWKGSTLGGELRARLGRTQLRTEVSAALGKARAELPPRALAATVLRTWW